MAYYLPDTRVPDTHIPLALRIAGRRDDHAILVAAFESAIAGCARQAATEILYGADCAPAAMLAIGPDDAEALRIRPIVMRCAEQIDQPQQILDLLRSDDPDVWRSRAAQPSGALATACVVIVREIGRLMSDDRAAFPEHTPAQRPGDLETGPRYVEDWMASAAATALAETIDDIAWRAQGTYEFDAATGEMRRREEG